MFSWYVFKIRLCSISSGFQNSEIPLVSFQTMAMFHTYSFQNAQITNCLLSAFDIQLCSVSSHLKHSVAYCFKLRLFQQYLFEISYNLLIQTYIQTVRFMKKKNVNKLALSNSISAIFSCSLYSTLGPILHVCKLPLQIY